MRVLIAIAFICAIVHCFAILFLSQKVVALKAFFNGILDNLTDAGRDTVAHKNSSTLDFRNNIIYADWIHVMPRT